jgi:hypothetical protein
VVRTGKRKAPSARTGGAEATLGKEKAGLRRRAHLSTPRPLPAITQLRGVRWDGSSELLCTPRACDPRGSRGVGRRHRTCEPTDWQYGPPKPRTSIAFDLRRGPGAGEPYAGICAGGRDNLVLHRYRMKP